VTPGSLLGSRERRPTVPPKVALPMVLPPPGPRSISACPSTWLLKYAEVVWCRSLASPNGMPSKVMLNWPSWKPRMLMPSFLPRPGPSGEVTVTLGAYLMMSSKLALKRSPSRMKRSSITEVGWIASNGAALGARVSTTLALTLTGARSCGTLTAAAIGGMPREAGVSLAGAFPACWSGTIVTVVGVTKR
jgi:hypothetical protein